DRARSSDRILPTQSPALNGCCAVGAELRQSFPLHQTCGESVEEIATGVAGMQYRAPPQPHAFAHPLLNEQWQNAGAHDRRLAAATHPKDEYKRTTIRCLRPQDAHDLSNRPPPSEENWGMLEVKRCKTPVG